MSAFLYRLGRAAARARTLVLVLWLVALALAGAAAGLLGQGTDDTFTIPGSPSQDALDHLHHVFPQASGSSAQLVIVVPAGQRADSDAVRAAVAGTIPELERVDQVASVVSPFADGVHAAVSPDGRAALVSVQLDVVKAEVAQPTRDALTALGERLAATIGGGATVYTGGDAFANQVPTLSLTEAVGVLIALLVLLVMFRSFVAAGLPLLTAVLGVGVSGGLILAATLLTPISSTAPMLAVMLGLAVGIDYALFILSRHRDQLAEGVAVEESIARATATAGSAVIFAGLTVVIAVLGLSVAGIPFLTTMAVAASGGVAMAVLVAVTLIPALLSFAGDRLRPRRRAGRRAGRRSRHQSGHRGRLSGRWVRLVTRVPALTIVLVVAGLAVCALPAADLRLNLPDNGTIAEGEPARVTYDVISEHFGPGFNGPLLVTVDIISTTDPVGITNAIAAEIGKVDGVQAIALATPNPRADTGIIQVVPRTAPDSARTADLVRTLRSMSGHFRAEYGVDTEVTGITAVSIDVSAQLGDALLPFAVLVVGLSLVLLTMVFRSIAVPLKATLGYLLSVGAAFGATSFVFGQGHLAGLLGVQRTGAVVSFLPIIGMGVLFGLAMDYEVFLVSRMREEYVHTGDADAAVRTGFVAASRVVVAAAAIMFAVFAAFVPEGSAIIKPIAFSLAVGVFVDAFLVRMTLVPAVLALLGRRAWWLPARLERRLPHFDVEGEGLVRELRLAGWPAPGSTELVSASGLGTADDRGRPVLSDVELHVDPGDLVAVTGHGPSGKSALLYALSGRVGRLAGDLKVGGLVLPQHRQAVRRRVALVLCRDTLDPAGEVERALADGVRLILLDDLDLVVRVDQRAALRDLFAATSAPSGAAGAPAGCAVVFTCQDLAPLADLLPARPLTILSLPAEPAAVPPPTAATGGTAEPCAAVAPRPAAAPDPLDAPPAPASPAPRPVPPAEVF